MIKDKVEIGIPGIDEMLEGGLIPARPYIVSGTAGTGKTAIAMRFLMEGAMNGEQVLYVAIDEPPNEVKANMTSFGWDISKIFVFDGTPDVLSYDKTPVRDISTERRVVMFRDLPENIRQTSVKGPSDMTINTIQELLKQEMKIRKYSRVVVDSVTSLRRFYIRTSEEYLILQSFFRLLSDLGITTILTVELPEISKPDAESHMARGEVRLYKWFDGRGLVRGVTIEKYRGSSHDSSMRSLKLDDTGVHVKVTTLKKKEKPKDEEEESAAATDDAGDVDATEGVVESPEVTRPASKPSNNEPPAPPEDGAPPLEVVPEELPPPPEDKILPVSPSPERMDAPSGGGDLDGSR
ncbi:MAG: hypothetical protein KKE24_00580 [Candidatus Thermoplasmatota archaeon]|nr:hypothetical protein [Candidatus Thermoplasmatota archaeon]